jgi:zinc protease
MLRYSGFMRRRAFFRLSAASLAAGWLQALEPTGADIVDRFVAATGPKALQDKITSEAAEGTVNMGAQGMTGSLKVLKKAGNTYTAIEIAGVGKLEEGVTNGVAWENNKITGARVRSGEEKAVHLRNAAIDLDSRWRKYFPKADFAGSETVAGEDCHKVILKPATGEPETRFFSKKTGLLLKVTATMPTQMGPMPMESSLSDYRDVQGLKRPFRLSINAGGQAAEMVFTKWTINAPIPDTAFAIPTEVAALVPKAAK